MEIIFALVKVSTNGSGIPILALLAMVKKLWGPRGPRTVVWGFKIWILSPQTMVSSALSR